MITAGNALLTTIDADTNSIKTSTAAIATDIAANEILITAGNALLTTIDADTNSIKTSTAAIATDIAANEILITAGNALLTTIDADTNDIKTSVQLIDDVVKAEDSPHSNTDKGIPCLVVRKDTQTQLASSDADYGMLQTNSTGALRVHNNGAYTSETNIFFTVNADGSGGDLTTKPIAGSSNFTSKVTANDANITQYLVEHNFSGSGVSYLVEEGLTTDGAFFDIRSRTYNEAGAPTSGTGQINDIGISCPFFRIKVTNANGSSRDCALSFIGKTTA